jgi:beta-lactamase class A
MSRLSLALLLTAAAFAQTSVTELLEQRTLTRVQEYAEKFDGALGVAVIDLAGGREFSLNGDTVFPQASSIKVPIMLRLFQAEKLGLLRLSDSVTLTKDDIAGGSGHLRAQLAKGPLTLTMREVITAMIETSDNTATNKCIDLVKMESVNRLMDEMGFLNTRLRRRMIDSAAVERGFENLSTPKEMARLTAMIYRGQAIDPEASGEMIGILKKVKAAMRGAVPTGIETASKPGSVSGVRCETGIIYAPNRPFVLSVMSTFVSEKSSAVADITRMVYDHFGKLGRANEWGHQYR